MSPKKPTPKREPVTLGERLMLFWIRIYDQSSPEWVDRIIKSTHSDKRSS